MRVVIKVGISTQKLHARGPMGLKELTTYKYIIHGDGHIRIISEGNTFILHSAFYILHFMHQHEKLTFPHQRKDILMKYGFIGCGNMGGAIARALCLSTRDIMITDRSGKGRTLAAGLGIAYGSAREIAETCDRIFLAVKPHMMAGVLEPLAPILAEKKPLLITMAAGLEIRKILTMAGSPLPCIRIMPNTPTAYGKGVIPYCANALVEHGVLEDWLRDMAPCGLLDELPENLIDASSALSGSGPAYFCLMLEALADGAVACGLPRAKAYAYAAATMAGTAEMALQTGAHPGALKDAVCSPGGSTIAGLRELEKGGFRSAAMECVIAAFQKNKELGK